ncbi:DDE-type integrase/transposase/recombinase [Streptomyces sp. NPDC001380]|uniref:DDE-type integrase/transposase/recombinase n=1 Tax=Streptomyces sp. NPDC001380 TaxID=3364566 RepID=UPI0036804C62
MNTRWGGGTTCIPVGSSWLCPAVVIDTCQRRVVGWSIADRMRMDLVADALEAAVAARGGAADVAFRTGHRPRHTSRSFACQRP